jgi:hypothetical protein
MRTLRSILGIVLGSLSFALAVQLLFMHVSTFNDLRATALPIASTLAPLERRLHLLNAQLELSALQASLRTSAAEEKLHVFVLPASTESERLLRFFETMRTRGEQEGKLRHMAPIIVTDAVPAPDMAKKDVDFPLTSRQATFVAEVQPEFEVEFQRIIDLSGVLTVGDLLTPEERNQLFLLTETEKPSAIVTLEKFFGTDALTYLRDPRLTDQQLSQVLNSDQATQLLHQILESPRLQNFRAIIQGPLGDQLIAAKLWPLQFLQIKEYQREVLPDGWIRLQIGLTALGRGENH